MVFFFFFFFFSSISPQNHLFRFWFHLTFPRLPLPPPRELCLTLNLLPSWHPDSHSKQRPKKTSKTPPPPPQIPGNDSRHVGYRLEPQSRILSQHLIGSGANGESAEFRNDQDWIFGTPERHATRRERRENQTKPGTNPLRRGKKGKREEKKGEDEPAAFDAPIVQIQTPTPART